MTPAPWTPTAEKVTMSRSEQIRNFLKEQGEPRLASEIAAGIGAAGDVRVSWTIGVMFRGNVLGREGAGKKMRYFVLRDPPKRRTTDQVRADKEQRRVSAAAAVTVRKSKQEAARLARVAKDAKAKDKPKPAAPPRVVPPSRAAITPALA